MSRNDRFPSRDLGAVGFDGRWRASERLKRTQFEAPPPRMPTSRDLGPEDGCSYEENTLAHCKLSYVSVIEFIYLYNVRYFEPAYSQTA